MSIGDAIKRLEDAKQRIREQMRTCTPKEASLLHDEIDRINGEIERLKTGDLPGQLKLF